MNEFLNRRTAERFDVAFDCKIEVGDEVSEGKIENLSLTGAEIDSPSTKLDKGEKVVLVIHGDIDELRLPAQVLRETSEGGTIGLRFIGDPRETASSLGPLIRRATRAKK